MTNIHFFGNSQPAETDHPLSDHVSNNAKAYGQWAQRGRGRRDWRRGWGGGGGVGGSEGRLCISAFTWIALTSSKPLLLSCRHTSRTHAALTVRSMSPA